MIFSVYRNALFPIGEQKAKIKRIILLIAVKSDIDHQEKDDMFCPGCGIEERQSTQFCRACGTDLRPVRFALEVPDTITASAVSAREEIGRAVAARIREAKIGELSEVAEDVLPEIEKFLESPEEKRLRRIRAGTITASIGLGATFAFAIAAMLMQDSGIFMVAGAGVVCFFLGLGIILNGMLLTIPKKSLSDRSTEGGRQLELDAQQPRGIEAQTNDLALPEPTNLFSSVTEHTTKHLGEKQPVRRG